MYLSDIIGKEQKITNSLTLFVAPPTPSKTAFIFWTRDSSLHLTFFRIPYTVHKGITCLPSFPFNLGIATVTMKSKTSGARSLISVSMLFQRNSTRFLWRSEGTCRTDGSELFLAQSMAHWASTSLMKTFLMAFLKEDIFMAASAIWCGLANWTAQKMFLVSSRDKTSLLEESFK